MAALCELAQRLECAAVRRRGWTAPLAWARVLRAVAASLVRDTPLAARMQRWAAALLRHDARGAVESLVVLRVHYARRLTRSTMRVLCMVHETCVQPDRLV